MKTVLFATTALVAFAGAASAASHANGVTVAFSGEMTAGYNDVLEGGLFWDAELNLDASVDLGDSVTATLSTEIVSGDELGGTLGFNPTIEITYTGAINASLKVGDLDDDGASEYFYSDRDGMAVDVENHDATSDARVLIEFGSIGIAVGCEVVESEVLPADFTGTCNDGAYNVGVGATFGSIELGVGYDNAVAGLQRDVIAVSAGGTFGSFDIGVSYASAGATVAPQTVVAAENSIGVEVGATFGAIEVAAYYASNSVNNDEYGVSADYAAGALSIGAYYDDDGTATYGVDVGYAVSDALTASAGIYDDASGTMKYYAGIEYTVNDNISATVSYANADEISGPEFKDGISAFITASF